MTRYQLDPMFDRTPDGAIKGIIRFDIYLDGHFVGSRRTHASCHEYLDELMPSNPEPRHAAATIHELPRRVVRCEGRECAPRSHRPSAVQQRLGPAFDSRMVERPR
jgi:hypothetical protein